MGCHAIDIGGGCLSCRVGANRADGALYQLEVLQLLIPELPKRIEGNLGTDVPGCGTFRNERIVKTHSGAFERKPAAEFVDKRFRILASQFLQCRACDALERSWGGTEPTTSASAMYSLRISAREDSSPLEEAGVAVHSASISLISIGDISIPVRLSPTTVVFSMLSISWYVSLEWL
jgi:hypothetical protein